MKLVSGVLIVVLVTIFWKLSLLILAAAMIATAVAITLMPDKRCLHEFRIIKDPETREPYLICKRCGEEDKR